MYTAYFGLDRTPFTLTPDPRFLYLSPQHREALAHLSFGTQEGGGFVQLTGEVGTGKTTVCRALLEQLPETVDTALILDPTLSAVELLQAICRELGVDTPPGETARRDLVERLNHHLLAANAAGRRSILVIDEAQNLGPELLEQLRLLTNLETADSKLLQIFLIGQPELRDQLARHELRQVAQRITARCHLGPLSRAETAAYVSHRLAVAGGERALFTRRALGAVHRHSRGLPRLVNMVCDRALLGAYATGAARVTGPIVARAARELRGGGVGRARPWARVHPALAAAGVVAAAALVVNLGLGGPFSPPAGADHGPALPKAAQALPDAATHRGATEPGDGAGTGPWERLAALWGVAVPPGPTPCETPPAGLACLEDRGGLGLLVRLNRPAVLPLSEAGGARVAGVLEGVGEETVDLYLRGQPRRLPRDELARRWDGSYQLWWRPPRGQDRLVVPGPGETPVLDWLRDILPAAGDAPGDLAARVRAFQRAEGVQADGIVGPQTFIRLNDLLGRGDVARLTPTGS